MSRTWRCRQTQPADMLIPQGTFRGSGNRRQAGTCARGKQSRHVAYITGSMLRVSRAGSKRCSEFGLDHRLNRQCCRPSAGPRLDLELQASNAVPFQLETIWWWNRLFLYHSPPAMAIRIPAGNAGNDPFRVYR